jgi:hypothetical protein
MSEGSDEIFNFFAGEGAITDDVVAPALSRKAPRKRD